MNGQISDRDEAVNVTGTQPFWRAIESSTDDASRGRDIAAGELLRGRTRARLVVALMIALFQGLVDLSMTPPYGARVALAALVVSLAVYAGIVSLVHVAARRNGGGSPALVTAMLAGDLAFVYVVTAATTGPTHYERALFGTVVLVHVANFSFGSRQAWRVVALGVAGYAGLLAFASSGGLLVQRSEHLWSLLICSIVMAFIVVQASDVRRRLRTLVGLFERAGEGDFTHAYDDAADRRPDAITRVGRAYNRVRAQLSDMVLTDPLTGCLNRRGFDQAVEREVARAARSRGEFALLALDLDHFKQVNDTYGHIAGDAVLRSIGALLLHAGRAGDVVARVGGEEFAILLGDTSAGGAHLFASRLCDLIRKHRFVSTEGAAPIRITTSIGVVAGSPRGTSDFASTLWANADAALYAAKRAGRDCVSELKAEAPQHPVAPPVPVSPTRYPGFLTL